MNKYHISLELPKILLTLSEMTSCEEARLAALSLQPSGDFFEEDFHLLSFQQPAL